MARLPRVTQQIFAGSATNNGQFGSAQAATFNLTNVLATIMALPAWGEGWLAATIGGSKFPPLEEFQALEYVHSSQIAYVLQQGIPEYDAGTTYFMNNMCAKAGTFQIYGSVADNNTGNALTNPTYWQFLADLSNVGGASTGDIKPTLKNAADSGWLLAQDQVIGDATFNTAVVANSMAITAGGAGHAVGDYVFYQGGAAIVVTGVSGGAITSFNEISDGAYAATPGAALTQSFTTGSGTASTLTITTTGLAGGLYYSNAAAQALFTLLWTNFHDYFCPVVGGRGGSAAADWAAHKGIRVPRAVGRVLGIAGTGVSLTARNLGQILGDEHLAYHAHALTDPTHSHSVNDPTHTHYAPSQSSGSDGGPVIAASNNPNTSATIYTASTGISLNANSTGITINAAGTGYGGNMQPTLFINWMIKL